MKRVLSVLMVFGFLIAGNQCGVAEVAQGACCQHMPTSAGESSCCDSLLADKGNERLNKLPSIQFQFLAGAPNTAVDQDTRPYPGRVFINDQIIKTTYLLHPVSNRAPPAMFFLLPNR